MRVLIAVDVEITDPTWTEQDVLNCLPDHLTAAIDSAERASHAATGNHGPYQVHTDDLTVWPSIGAFLRDVRPKHR